MPPLASSTVKPSLRRQSTYQAAERYSRQAVSPNSQIDRVHADQSGRLRSTQSRAVAFASDISRLPVRRLGQT
jgi:hypothetical protein